MDSGFQLAITIACWVIAAMFVVQVVAWLRIYSVLNRVTRLVENLHDRFEPQLAKIQKTIDDLQTAVSTVSVTVTTISGEVRAVSGAVTTSAERISVIATESAEEIKEMVARTSAEIKEMVTTTTTEVNGLVTTSSVTARGAVDRLDLMVERSAVRVEETGIIIQETVLNPIREISAIIAGIRAALDALMGYPKRKQIDQAYSEEELFI